MVFGNLGPRSGSGVLLTTDPGRAVDALFSGDFTVQSQGDDVVGGLVTTFPITERQRHTEARDADIPVRVSDLRRYRDGAECVGVPTSTTMWVTGR